MNLWTLYINIDEDDTPKGSSNKKKIIASQKRNLLLREKWLNKSQLNEEVSNGEIYI
jgi:hypothetical protein